MSASLTHPTPIAIAVVEQDGQFLIGQRPPGVALAGLWEFPGGKIEPGETPEAAAVRECLEETGILVEPLFRYPEREHAYAHDRVQLIFVACRVVSGTPDLPREPFRWVTRAKLSEYEFPAANVGLLAILSCPVEQREPIEGTARGLTDKAGRFRTREEFLREKDSPKSL